jgi:hypothetical protein
MDNYSLIISHACLLILHLRYYVHYFCNNDIIFSKLPQEDEVLRHPVSGVCFRMVSEIGCNTWDAWDDYS